MAGGVTRTRESQCRRHHLELSWDAAAGGLIKLASEMDVAVCRLHYYLQRMHSHKVQLETLWRPSRLQVCALEAAFRADVESYLVGVRQDVARLEAAQFSLRGVLATDSSSPGSASGDSPRRPLAGARYMGRGSPSPRKPALGTLREESSRTESDNASRRQEDPTSTVQRRKRAKRGDQAGPDPSLLVAELGERLRDLQGEESGEEAEDAWSTATQASSTAGLPGAGGGGTASSSEGAAEGASLLGAGGGTPASSVSAGGGGMLEAVESSQDSSFARMELLSPRSTLLEIRDHQDGLYDDLQLHSQRLILVASTRRWMSSTYRRRHRRKLGPGQMSGDARALLHSVEAAARELLSARDQLLSRAEALRRLAAAVDEAGPQRPPAKQLRHLPSLQPQPLPQLRRPRAHPRSCCTGLRRLLHSFSCTDFCTALWQFLGSCFCCCAYRHSSAARDRPIYESTWLLRSPPRSYSTSCL